MGAIGSFILLAMSGAPRLTEHGKKYLERLQLAFEKFKYSAKPTNSIQSQQTATTFGAIDPLLLGVGVFGTAALMGTPYDNYNQAFNKSQQAQTSGGSSCGSGCGTSSDSSSCSSGGDGGSGCGGGCGGGCG
jgi:hypothetical protein